MVQIETEVEVVGSSGRFVWSVSVQPQKAGSRRFTVSATAASYLRARLEASDFCRRLTRAALSLADEARSLAVDLGQKTNSPKAGKALRAAV